MAKKFQKLEEIQAPANQDSKHILNRAGNNYKKSNWRGARKNKAKSMYDRHSKSQEHLRTAGESKGIDALKTFTEAYELNYRLFFFKSEF